MGNPDHTASGLVEQFQQPSLAVAGLQVAAHSQFEEDDIRVSCNIRVGDRALASQVFNGREVNGAFPAAT